MNTVLKRFSLYNLMILGLLGFTSCGDDEDEDPVPTASITVDQFSTLDGATLSPGERISFEYSVTDPNKDMRKRLLEQDGDPLGNNNFIVYASSTSKTDADEANPYYFGWEETYSETLLFSAPGITGDYTFTLKLLDKDSTVVVSESFDITVIPPLDSGESMLYGQASTSQSAASFFSSIHGVSLQNRYVYDNTDAIDISFRVLSGSPTLVSPDQYTYTRGDGSDIYNYQNGISTTFQSYSGSFDKATADIIAKLSFKYSNTIAVSAGETYAYTSSLGTGLLKVNSVTGTGDAQEIDFEFKFVEN